MAKCKARLKVAGLVLVNKKSMRHFKRFVEEGNMEKINKQIKEGKVRIYN